MFECLIFLKQDVVLQRADRLDRQTAAAGVRVSIAGRVRGSCSLTLSLQLISILKA